MNLFKHTLTAASVALAMAMPGVTSAMPTLVDDDTVTAPTEQMQLLRARLQRLEAQKRDLESEMLRMQEAQRRSESTPEAGAPDMPGSNPSPGPQANNCSSQRHEGGQTGGSCGTADMMQGMMQMMGQMMRSAPAMLSLNPSPGPQANNCSRQRQEGGSCGTADMMQGMMQTMGQMMRGFVK